MQEIRDLKVKMKLSPIRELIKGKRLVVIDDSIVRGTTSKKIVQLLKDAGAKSVHMRIASPPINFPCFYGVDTPTKEELIGNRMNGVSEIEAYMGVDSLAYLSIDAMLRASEAQEDFCTACFDGNYMA